MPYKMKHKFHDYIVEVYNFQYINCKMCALCWIPSKQEWALYNIDFLVPVENKNTTLLE